MSVVLVVIFAVFAVKLLTDAPLVTAPAHSGRVVFGYTFAGLAKAAFADTPGPHHSRDSYADGDPVFAAEFVRLNQIAKPAINRHAAVSNPVRKMEIGSTIRHSWTSTSAAASAHTKYDVELTPSARR